VIDAAGAPISGVHVSTRRAGGSGHRDFFPRESPCPQESTAAAGPTDREGRFDLAPLEPGLYTVWAGDGSAATQSALLRLTPGQALDGLRLVIERGVQVAGRVTARDGSPVPEATVFVGTASTTTDAAGRYRLTGAAPGHNRVRTTDREHGPLDREVELAAGENRLDLVLPEPTEIRGRVLGPGGGPTAGATVKIWPVHTATGADGTFRLKIPTCSCGETLTVNAAGLAPAEVEVRGQPGALEIRLSRPGAVIGRVLGLRSPAGTRITASSYPSRRQPEAIADAAGRFRLPALTPGAWTFLATTQEGRMKVGGDVVVAPGEERTLDIAFPPAYRVSGWVVDGNGRPATCDVVVFARIHVPCRGDGTFTAELEDGSYDPWVGGGGRAQLHEPLKVVVAGAPIDRVEVRLLPWITVVGRILGLEPDEIPDSVRAERTGEAYGLNGFGGMADQDGRYRIEMLSGDWEIQAHFGAMTALRRLHVPADATRIESDLAFPTGPYTLAGRVVGGQAAFELAGPDGSSVTSSPSAEGRFLFSRLAAGTYRLRALRYAKSDSFRWVPDPTSGPHLGNILLERTVQVPAPPETELVVDLTSQ
jgi:hypothetical protein